MKHLHRIFTVLSIVLLASILVACATPTINPQQPDNSHYMNTLRLAESGDVEAQYKLGKMFYDGEGVTQNYQEAEKWLLLASEQEHTDAQYWLSSIYFMGSGNVQQDCNKAIKFVFISRFKFNFQHQ